MSASGFTNLLSTLDTRRDFREFERICRWFLLNAPEYRFRIRRVWLWSEWPGAWGRDAGIDLIAEERDGGLWAIQAKLYDPAYAIKKADVDSFLSESARYDFAYRLLIATTDRLGPTARQTLYSQRRPVGYLLRSQLELAPVAWPKSPADLRPHRPARKKPLPHVREAIADTTKGLASQARGQLIMACGTGKTLAGLWISERLRSTRTLVLVPSLSLLAQTLREWSANGSGTFDYLAVCSDATVVGEDKLIQRTSELGLPVTTNPDAIAAFLRQRGRRVVFATYQSSPQVAAACRTPRAPAFDLTIADEAHRCAGRTSSEFATILDARKIRSRRRLFMTATPRFFTPRLRDEAGLAGFEVASMDEETVFGPVLHRLTFGEAIERALLSDYQVVVVGVDNATYRAWAERGEFVTPDGDRVFDARTLAGHIATAKAMRKYGLRRLISFHSRVNTARRFSDNLPYVIAWMPARERPRHAIWSEHVSGAMTSGHRERLLLRFRDLAPDEIGLLTNARCLGEGVDVPTLDGVAFIDPRRSTTDIIQAVGRAIRKAPDKSVGTIILPVFITDEEPAKALDDSTFRCVWGVLKALRAHDEILGEELDELRRSLGARRSPIHRPQKIKLDLPVAVVSAAFAEAFNTRLVEQTTGTWDYWYGLLLAYVSRTGDSRVPTHYVDNGYKLGQWVASQRSLYSNGELSDARAHRLASLPRWTWHTHRDAWEDGYERMRRFVAREGHADVPKGFVDQDGSRLDLWALHQRADYRSGKLSGERARRVEELDGWEWEPEEAAFNRGLERVRTYIERHGNASIPNDYVDEDGFKLGQWVQNRRKGYKKGHLAASSIAALEAVPGWRWSLKEDAWEKGYQRLTAFVSRHEHARVHKDYRDTDGYLLGSWVSNQRHKHSIGRLPTDRVARLEQIEGWAWGGPRRRRSTFDAGLAELAAYVNAHGHARVPAGYKTRTGFELGVWCAGRRAQRKVGRLSEERVAALDALGFVWYALQEAFDRGLAELAAYVAENGDARVPQKYTTATGFNLGTWCSERRRQRKHGRLSSDRVAALDTLGFVWKATAGRRPSPNRLQEAGQVTQLDA